jgi:serine/threonine protein phosphatase PrpC
MSSTTPHVPHIGAVAAEPAARRTAAAGLSWAALSLRGTRGGANEDALLARPPHFFGVADGVGSGSHGEVASQVALQYCAAAQDLRARALVRQVQGADAAVADALARLSDRPGAATLVALWLRGRSARLLHVGDARALLFRRGWRGRWRLLWRTEDQTYAALGKTPPERGDANDPCRMVGTGVVGEPGLKRFRLGPRDLLLLCSDGLHRHVPGPALARPGRPRPPNGQPGDSQRQHGRHHGAAAAACAIRAAVAVAGPGRGGGPGGVGVAATPGLLLNPGAATAEREDGIRHGNEQATRDRARSGPCLGRSRGDR